MQATGVGYSVERGACKVEAKKKTKGKVCICRGGAGAGTQADGTVRPKACQELPWSLRKPQLAYYVQFVQRQLGVDIQEMHREAGARPISSGPIHHQKEFQLDSFLQKLFLDLSTGQAFFLGSGVTRTVTRETGSCFYRAK